MVFKDSEFTSMNKGSEPLVAAIELVRPGGFAVPDGFFDYSSLSIINTVVRSLLPPARCVLKPLSRARLVCL